MLLIYLTSMMLTTSVCCERRGLGIERGHNNDIITTKGKKFSRKCIRGGKTTIFTSTLSSRLVCYNRGNIGSLSCVSDEYEPVLCTVVSEHFSARIAFRNVNPEHCMKYYIWNIVDTNNNENNNNKNNNNNSRRNNNNNNIDTL